MKNKIFKILSVAILSSCIMMPSSSTFAKGIKTENTKEYALATSSKNTKLQDGKYNVSIEVLKEKTEELSMAGQYINKKADIEVKNNKKYATLKITRMDWMKNIKIFANDKSLNYQTTKKDKEGKLATVRFEVPDLNSNIKFKMNVVPMGNAEVKFRVHFNNDINKVSNGSSNKDNNQNKSTSTVNNTNKNTVKNTDEKSETKNVTINSNSSKGKNDRQDGGKSDELPQTGSPITTKSLSIMGGLAIVLGMGLKIRKKA